MVIPTPFSSYPGTGISPLQPFNTLSFSFFIFLPPCYWSAASICTHIKQQMNTLQPTAPSASTSKLQHCPPCALGEWGCMGMCGVIRDSQQAQYTGFREADWHHGSPTCKWRRQALMKDWDSEAFIKMLATSMLWNVLGLLGCCMALWNRFWSNGRTWNIEQQFAHFWKSRWLLFGCSLSAVHCNFSCVGACLMDSAALIFSCQRTIALPEWPAIVAWQLVWSIFDFIFELIVSIVFLGRWSSSVALCSLPLTVSLFHCWHCSTVQLSIYQIYTHTHT